MARKIELRTRMERLSIAVRSAVGHQHTYAVTGDFTPLLFEDGGRLSVWRLNAPGAESIGDWEPAQTQGAPNASGH